MELSMTQLQALQTILKQDKSIYLLVGAVGSGKTMLASLVFGMLVRKKAREGQIFGLGYTKESFIRNTQNELDRFGIVDLEHSTRENYVVGDFKIPIYGGCDTRRASSIRGMNASFCFIEELTRIHPEVFQETIRRLRKGENACCVATTNPDSPSHWCYEMLIKNPPPWAEIITLTMNANPALSEGYKNRLKNLYATSDFLYRRFVLGEWVVGSGKIYDFSKVLVSARKITNMKERFWDRKIQTIWGIDFGTKNPSAFVKISVLPTHEVLVEEEIVLTNAKKRHTISDLAELIGKNCKNSIVTVDPSAMGLIEEVSQRHKEIKITPGTNSVIDGIRLVQSLVAEKRLLINKNCRTLIAESEQYSWKEATEISEKERVVKKDDHTLDALRYACMSALPFLRRKREGISSSQVAKFIYERELY